MRPCGAIADRLEEPELERLRASRARRLEEKLPMPRCSCGTTGERRGLEAPTVLVISEREENSMSVEFGGMGSMVVTMKAVAAPPRRHRGMDGHDTVRNANGGVAPVGGAETNGTITPRANPGYVRVKWLKGPPPRCWGGTGW